MNFAASLAQFTNIDVSLDYTFYGILVRGGTFDEVQEQWENLKKRLLFAFWGRGPSLTIKMPCGSSKVFPTKRDVENIPMVDMPCDCGRANHYYFKFEIRGEGNA